MENHRACSEDEKRTLMMMGLSKEFDYKHKKSMHLASKAPCVKCNIYMKLNTLVCTAPAPITRQIFSCQRCDAFRYISQGILIVLA